jgi:predicted dehydrogenase
MTKRIGFVDNNLENFHANVYLSAVRNELLNRGYEVSGCTALMADAGRVWAGKNKVPYFDSVEQLDHSVDYYVVLAPNNPETHLELCSQVLPMGKTTYVDKTFAPDLVTAQTIFALADRYGTAMQTTSALRYTNVQTYVDEVGKQSAQHMVAWGGGSSFNIYAIHPLELVVSCMGSQVKRVMRRGTGDRSQLLLDYAGGRTAVINVYPNSNTPFAASVTTDTGTRYIKVDDSTLFVDMAKAILDLFDTGKPSIDRAESLVIRQILDIAATEEVLQRFVTL